MVLIIFRLLDYVNVVLSLLGLLLPTITSPPHLLRRNIIQNSLLRRLHDGNELNGDFVLINF